jgi:hypothetical protein
LCESSSEAAAEGTRSAVASCGRDGRPQALAKFPSHDPKISPDAWITRTDVLHQQDKMVPLRIVGVSEVVPAAFEVLSRDVSDGGRWLIDDLPPSIGDTERDVGLPAEKTRIVVVYPAVLEKDVATPGHARAQQVINADGLAGVRGEIVSERAVREK